MSVGMSSNASGPVTGIVTSTALRYGATAWPRVPVSMSGSVQLGFTVGVARHG